MTAIRVNDPMCFSPEADFTAGVLVAGVGIETLRRVESWRELVVGALPLLFGIHQLVEGFVWLGLRGQVSSELGATAKDVYIVYAHAVLPVLVPLGFLLLEPDRRRARWLWPLAAVGLLLGAYLLREVTAYPVGANEVAHCINYTTHTPNDYALGAVYVAATCGPALLSSRAYLRWFGVASVVGMIATAIVRVDQLTSLWCVYVALVSVLILEHFRRQRARDAGGAHCQYFSTVSAERSRAPSGLWPASRSARRWRR
ncbi:MAG: putative rane protein [Solirubrobacterales bacterium]|nr:putative rane protein [Solirubrobacterales bacterium]